MANVYAVVSETMHEISYDRLEEDWRAIAVIVAAKNRGQARYLAAKSQLKPLYRPNGWPRMWVKRIGSGWPDFGVLSDEAASPWWEKVGDWNPEVKHGGLNGWGIIYVTSLGK